MLLYLSCKPTTLSSVQPGLQNITAATLLKKIFQCGQAKLELSPVNKVLNFILEVVQGHLIEPCFLLLCTNNDLYNIVIEAQVC